MIDRSFVYILKCADQSLYTGWTVNLKKRIVTHNSGKGAKYTRARLPVELVYYESYPNRILAQKREYRIKKLSRSQKLRMINGQNLSKLND